ncbi:MAG: Acetoin utilization protein AcuC [Formosa sp. Hel3_A1_48]|nr:MAG: Acetoin utilization protein AcuC [Formosa sp. Hel3_A1_48]
MLKIAFDPIYKHNLKVEHRFPMEKYELLPQQLLRKNICEQAHFFAPTTIEKKHVLSTHCETYYEDLVHLTLGKLERRQIGFPLSEELVKREHVIAQGTIQNTHFAMEHGISMNIAGGTHHAYRAKPGAFCMLNDQSIAANYLIDNKLSKKVMIIDLDVHQGDGTASIFQGQDSVFTISFHGQKNYPFKKQTSDFDLALEDHTNDETYLKALAYHIPRLVDAFQPEFIFYLAGVDVLNTDKLGRLGLSIKGCKERDRFVLELCKNNNIPVQVSMGGGYSIHLKDIIDAHSNTFEVAQEIFF